MGTEISGVNEWIVSVIRAMYEDATTKVKLNGREFEATCGQLDPLLG